MRKLSVFCLLFAIALGSQAQNFMMNKDREAEKTRGYSSDLKYGFIPFSRRGQLRDVFNGYGENASYALKELQYTSVSLSVDSINSNSFYVEVFSLTPGISIGRFSLGSQITQSDIQSDSSASYRSLAIRKMMNGGGNFSLNFNRPLVYAPFTDANRNYFLLNCSATVYADVTRMNSFIYNPGLGAQVNLDFDLRLLSNKSEIMIGNLYRMGIRGRMLYNAFDAKYRNSNDIDGSLNNMIILAGSVYAGLGPIFVELGYNFSNRNIIEGNQNLLKVSLQPVKF